MGLPLPGSDMGAGAMGGYGMMTGSEMGSPGASIGGGGGGGKGMSAPGAGMEMGTESMAAPGGVAGAKQPPRDKDGNVIPIDFPAPKFSFTFQFAWQESPRSIRLKKKEEEEKAKKEAAAAEASVASNN